MNEIPGKPQDDPEGRLFSLMPEDYDYRIPIIGVNRLRLLSRASFLGISHSELNRMHKERVERAERATAGELVDGMEVVVK